MAYPYLGDIIKALTGIDLPLPIPVFGLSVVLAMFVAGAVLRRELARLHASGELGYAQLRYRTARGERARRPVAPADVVSDLTLVTLAAGIVGARVFHILEHTDGFLADPAAMIFTRSGLSIFGGLIFGTLAGLVCVRRWQLPAPAVLDAAAPALMLGYALGRIGCQLSGDGDWGIAADMALKPDWLPAWLWAQTYENNIVGEVIALPGVYPTPLYEAAMCIALFGVLWALRRHGFQKGWLFAVYLVCAGIERLLIEQIRHNPVLDFGVFRCTQAEVIAVLLILCGLAATALLARRQPARRMRV
ncbi:prolipoprotein diacylglyceryl transferase [Massilia dura]|uniref:Phosphatidylglycerol--prolipoprotein diacylglyceryl transferase n=1 Tax=Pseudoduganella dura TaxID=321982 RepID=A0A6I3X6B2_9BURK|nr:prolipoprotein diacylglyceryl transferase [Pseudoduganella dura]MUI11787.1 prolipoprotein diacylglyceryl transferase [Pseudoduganella dura]GGX79117.1 prolipoprotein diacylglyceryl transferase [Pseudoduganella dura]